MRNFFGYATWAGVIMVLDTLLSGCASAPQYRYYTIDMTPRAELTPPVRIEGVRISINQALQRPEIMIRTSPTQVEYYAIDRWASGLEEQIAGKINTEFASASSDLQPFNITATLMAFEQVDTPAGPEVLVKLDANIQPSFDATGQEPIFLRKLYVVTRPAAAPGAAAAVEALSRATEAIASEMAADIAAVVAQPSKS